MSDTKLRELERRWKETGSVEDEAAYLLERVRVGDLTQERLELAAYCGHRGAVAALPSPALPSADHPVAGLADWGVDVQALAAVVAASTIARSEATTLSVAHPQLVEAVEECARTFGRGWLGSQEKIRSAWAEMRAALAAGTAEPLAGVLYEALMAGASPDDAEKSDWVIVALSGLRERFGEHRLWEFVRGPIADWATNLEEGQGSQPHGQD